MRLLEEDVSFVSASSIFEQECVSRGSSVDMIIPAFALRLQKAIATMSSADSAAVASAASAGAVGGPVAAGGTPTVRRF